MKKIAGIFAGCSILFIGIFLLFGNSPEQDTLIPETAQTPTAKTDVSQEAPPELQVAETTESPVEDDFPITKEQFQSLPIIEQQEIL